MDEATSGPRAVSLRMRLVAPPGLVDDLRRFTERLIAAAQLGEGRACQLALAMHELLENAIRHGGHEPVELAIAIVPEKDQVTIAVGNVCGGEEFDGLRARLDRLNADPDALHAYVETIRHTPLSIRGGLGLPRVRFESDLALDARHDGRRVTITARGSLAPRPIPSDLRVRNG